MAHDDTRSKTIQIDQNHCKRTLATAFEHAIDAAERSQASAGEAVQELATAHAQLDIIGYSPAPYHQLYRRVRAVGQHISELQFAAGQLIAVTALVNDRYVDLPPPTSPTNEPPEEN